MSTYSRGKRFEKIVWDDLKVKGHTLFFKSMFVRFGMIDFANTWDLVTYYQGEWYFTQCKSSKIYGKEKQMYHLWKMEYGLPHMRFWLAIKNKKQNRVTIDYEEL